MSALSGISKTLKTLGEMIYGFFVMPQEFRSIIEKRSLSDSAIAVASAVAFMFALPLFKTTAYVMSDGAAVEVKDRFVSNLILELNVLLMIAIMALLLTVFHWTFSKLAGEAHSFRQLLIFSIHLVAAWTLLNIVLQLSLLALQKAPFFPAEWTFASYGGVLLASFYYLTVVQVVNFPPFRAGLWAMFLLVIPNSIIFVQAMLTILS
jgi:hypothetical protein